MRFTVLVYDVDDLQIVWWNCKFLSTDEIAMMSTLVVAVDKVFDSNGQESHLDIYRQL